MSEERKYVLDFEQIDKQTPIGELATALGLAIKKTGNTEFIACPRHKDDTPSCQVNHDTNTCYCYSCKEVFGPIKLTMEVNHLKTRGEAASFLAQRLGMDVTTSSFTPRFTNLYKQATTVTEYGNFMLLSSIPGQQAHQYLLSRGLNDKTIEKARLGIFAQQDPKKNLASLAYEDKANNRDKFDLTNLSKLGLLRKNEKDNFYTEVLSGRLIIPIINDSNQVVGFSGRDLSTRSDQAKYIMAPNSDIFKKSDYVYGYDQETRKIVHDSKELYIVEGFFDCLALKQAGFTNTVALMGTNLPLPFLQEIKDSKARVHLLLDNDEPGRREATTIGVRLYQEDVKTLVYNQENLPGKDFGEILQKKGESGVKNALQNLCKPLDVYAFAFDRFAKDFNSFDPNSLIDFRQHMRDVLKTAPDNIREYYTDKVKEQYNLDLVPAYIPPMLEREDYQLIHRIESSKIGQKFSAYYFNPSSLTLTGEELVKARGDMINMLVFMSNKNEFQTMLLFKNSKLYRPGESDKDIIKLINNEVARVPDKKNPKEEATTYAGPTR